MPEITRHAIRVYAAISALRGEKGDVLDALIPFFFPILNLMNQKVFDPKAFAGGVRKLYGWNFTSEIVETFIPRLVDKGYLKRLARTGGEVAYGVTFIETLPEKGDNILADFEAILDQFNAFPTKVTDLLNFQRTREELADILLRFLVETRAFPKTKGEPDPEAVPEIKEGGRELTDEDRYLAARFVQTLTTEQPAAVDTLAHIASIGLLAEVVDDFSRPLGIPQKAELNIYLDAPVALDYLGLSGRAIEEDVSKVLNSLRDIGCRLLAFPATCAEMSRNLNSMLALQPPQRHGYTHEAMLRREVDGDYVRAVANMPEQALAKRGIEIRQMDLNNFPNSHRYFTTAQYEDFLSAIFWVKDIVPKEHDATCMTLLMRLREGRQSPDIFNTRSVFVTRNGAFAGFSRRYCLQSQLLNPHQEGPVVHQRELATVAWLRTGLGEAETIPRSYLVASCERVLRVRPEVVEAIKQKVAGVTAKAEQLELLLLDYRSIRKLADETLNDESVVTAENADHLLDLMRKATADEARKDYDKKLRSQREEHRATTARKQQEYEGQLRAREEEVVALLETTDILSAASTTASERDEKTRASIAKSVNGRLNAVRWMVTGLLLLAGVISALNLFGEWWRWLLAIVGVGGLYQLLAQLLHWPAVGVRDLQGAIAPFLLKREIRRRETDWITADVFSVSKGVVRPLPESKIAGRKEDPLPI